MNLEYSQRCNELRPDSLDLSEDIYLTSHGSVKILANGVPLCIATPTDTKGKGVWKADGYTAAAANDGNDDEGGGDDGSN